MAGKNLLLGCKYFKYSESGELEIIRVYRRNESEVRVYDDNDKDNKWKLTIEELNNSYVKLNPHAIVNFCLVKIGNNLDDVIVTAHKMSDLEKNEPTPYCVCRQNITDLFANQIIGESGKLYVGCSMSLETCPPDVDYRMMIACNEMKKCINVCAYMDDTLDSILDLVKTKEYDTALYALLMDHINYEISKDPKLIALKGKIDSMESHDGYCKTLKKLLAENNFMYDFYRGFNIVPLDIEITYDESSQVVSEEITKIISDMYEIEISSTLCMKYWYDIDLSKIDNQYALFIDKNNDLYVIAFISGGRKHINIEDVESDENIQKLLESTLKNNLSIKETAEHIRMYKDKYN